uniref:Glucosamine 6-phosphate N-acetyltransferase n=1 Tax=Phlebotomus papatasi TaxID=29031 RepID=A0A1B0D3Z6_PHLPP
MSGERDELTLYEPKLLHELQFWQSPAKFNPPITAVAPGETWMKVRPLQEGDYDRGFLELLSQLTKVGNVSKAQFLMQFAQMRASGGYYVTVIEDTRINRIIGSATLRGRLEDVVVNNTYRGKQLGKLIVVTVTLLAKHLGCYKMSLDCKDNLIPFYESLGYVLEPGNSNAMNIRYDGQKETTVRNRPTASVILANATNPVDPS